MHVFTLTQFFVIYFVCVCVCVDARIAAAI